MNIIKGLTAVTSLTVLMGMTTPTAVVHAKQSSTNDSQAVIKEQANAISADSANTNKAVIFGNGLLSRQERSQSIAVAQRILHQLGYYNGSIDGIFGAQTLAALGQFQKNNGTVTENDVSAATKTALFDLYCLTTEYRNHIREFADIQAKEQAAAAALAEQQREAALSAAEAAAQAAAQAAQQAAAAAAQQQKQAAQSAAAQIQTVAYHPIQPVQASGNSITVLATSYALSGSTATGIDLSSNPSAKVIAVDPSVIPLGSRVLIPGYGVYTAADTGGAIRGNRIDVHFATQSEALNFGVQRLTIQILH
ncbi:MAG: 3D domain-containing protein [Sporolactobacillus sp.]